MMFVCRHECINARRGRGRERERDRDRARERARARERESERENLMPQFRVVPYHFSSPSRKKMKNVQKN